ncbi:hypothetical protein G7Z17_g4373 [Cylindrodendrum hubeiense]|uniref:Uncharacterized protein n=1 Tax=Cylindrodendrum hubeiense TaxID=595255 RepID=A0A9P5HE24_9HYPO|nr:hypothetical protein G7Z17_g4373 [Cylindrodendrum hubeiense]
MNPEEDPGGWSEQRLMQQLRSLGNYGYEIPSLEPFLNPPSNANSSGNGGTTTPTPGHPPSSSAPKNQDQGLHQQDDQMLDLDEFVDLQALLGYTNPISDANPLDDLSPASNTSLPESDTGPDGNEVNNRNEQTPFRYLGYVNSSEQAAALRRTFNDRSDLNGGITTKPESDATFPQTEEQYRGRVREIVEAMCDWSRVTEWRTRMGRENTKEWIEEYTREHGPISQLDDADLKPPENRMPSLVEQWRNVTHREMDDLTIELLGAEILQGISNDLLWSNRDATREKYASFQERWAVVLEGFQTTKALIHSAIQASWMSRITRRPRAEKQRKTQNKSGNDLKRKKITNLGESVAKKAKPPADE